jgi:hypothetical protein
MICACLVFPLLSPQPLKEPLFEPGSLGFPFSFFLSVAFFGVLRLDFLYHLVSDFTGQLYNGSSIIQLTRRGGCGRFV